MEALDTLLCVTSSDIRSSSRALSSPARTVSPTRRQSPTTPRLASRGTTRENVSSSKLFRDISPTKAFTQAAPDSSRVSLPELFKQKEGLASLRPQYSIDFLQRQEEAVSQPRLLQRLEGLLQEKLSLIGRVGATGTGFAATRMRTDAHRQVFDAFLHSFTTYRSLLIRIKGEYDAALDDAMGAVFDNVHMRADLAMSEPKMDAAVRSARQRALQDAAASRKEIQDEVDQQEATAAEAERRCLQADAEMQTIKSNTAQLQQEIEQLTKQISEAKHGLLAASSWATPALLARYTQGQSAKQAGTSQTPEPTAS